MSRVCASLLLAIDSSIDRNIIRLCPSIDADCSTYYCWTSVAMKTRQTTPS